MLRAAPAALFLVGGCTCTPLARVQGPARGEMTDPTIPKTSNTFQSWVVQTREIDAADGTEKIVSNHGFHYAFDGVNNFSCFWGGQDLQNPSQIRYKA